MIKRYNDFVKGKINEDLTMSPQPEVKPNTPGIRPETTPGTKPANPSPIRRERTSPVPAPAKAELEEEVEEEGGEYKGNQLLAELADKLGTEVKDGHIDYNGKTINFYSETEMFHVDNKKFKTSGEVITYLESINPEIKSETSEIENELPEGGEKFESKSYKYTRKFQRSKK